MDNSTNREKLNLTYRSVFTRQDGIRVLDDLYAQFMDKPSKPPLDALTLAFREGQRDVIRFIMLKRDISEREQQTTEDSE